MCGGGGGIAATERATHIELNAGGARRAAMVAKSPQGLRLPHWD